MKIKIKTIALIEAVIIILLSVVALWNTSLNPNLSIAHKFSYCDKYMYEDKTCLISPAVSISDSNQANQGLIFNFKPLQQDIQDFLDSNGLNSSVSLYVVNLRDSTSFGIGANNAYGAASLNKLPIAIIIMKKIELGEFTMDTYLPIYSRDRDSGSGSLYNYTGNQMQIRDLLFYMLTQSDNTASKVLGEQITINDLQGLSSYLNLYTQDINYTTNSTIYVTPKSEANVLTSLYLSSDLKPEDSEYLLSLLTNQTGDKFNVAYVAELPSNATIADKYGEYYFNNEKELHDCGIMYLGSERILYCIMTRNLDLTTASSVIGIMVNKVYYYFESANSS